MGEPIMLDFKKLASVEVAEFQDASRAFKSTHMSNLALMVGEAFEAEFAFIVQASARNKPADADLRQMIQPIIDILSRIEEFREKNRHLVEYSNHMSTIAESIVALNWITLPRAPAQYVRDMKEAGDYFGNRVLTANKGNKLHANWIVKWSAVLTSLENYVKAHHTTGFVWNYQRSGKKEAEGVAPPPPPPPPSSPSSYYFGFGDAGDPPVTVYDTNKMDKQTLAKQLLMKDINQGVDIIRTLKHVDPSARRPATTASAQLGSPRGAQKAAASDPSHPPVFASEGKKWRVEYQKNVQSMELNPTDKSESLAMYKCENSSLETKAKMNAVTIDNCKKCVVVLQHIISSVELIRCERCEIRCMGNCQNVTLDSCDSIQVFLNGSSANCQVISSKSTSTNVCLMTENGDYDEFPVPEQIRSVLVNNKLQSSVVEHRM